jgi:hypothetical protein
MTENQKTTEVKKEFKPVKKLSPFVVDPYNNLGQKGGKQGGNAPVSSGKGGKKINITKFKGGSGGDR